MTPEEIDRIRKRAAKAREGAWYSPRGPDGETDYPGYDSDCVYTRGDDEVLIAQGCHPDDADFIAHARLDVPALLDALEASQDRVRRLEEALTIATDTALIASRAYRAALQEGKT